MKKEEVEQLVDLLGDDMTESDKPAFCVACGEQLRQFSLLICTDCLNDDCSEFVSIFEEPDGK